MREIPRDRHFLAGGQRRGQPISALLQVAETGQILHVAHRRHGDTFGQSFLQQLELVLVPNVSADSVYNFLDGVRNGLLLQYLYVEHRPFFICQPLLGHYPISDAPFHQLGQRPTEGRHHHVAVGAFVNQP